jgi:hypothetical protein
VQAASVFLFFIPGLVIRTTKWGRSPYVRYWAKVNLIWSLYSFVFFALFAVLHYVAAVKSPMVVVWCAHALMTIMGAFAAMFNRPVGYFVIAERFCLKEMAAVYGSLVGPESEE